MHSLACVTAIALLLGLAWSDLARRRLPNLLIGALAVLYFVVAVTAHVSAWSMASHVGVALLAFVAGLALFAVNAVAGGDVKFVSAVCLWAGTKFVLLLVAMISIAGLGVVIAVLVATWLVRQLPSSGLAALARPWCVQRGVPYGVAIALGAFPVVVVRTLAGGMTL